MKIYEDPMAKLMLNHGAKMFDFGEKLKWTLFSCYLEKPDNSYELFPDPFTDTLEKKDG